MNASEALQFLEDLVRIDSPSRQEGMAAKFLVQRMNQWGFEAHLDAVGNAIGYLGPNEVDTPRLALVGHVDTVPGNIPVRVEGGRLFGRGSVDAKGCLAAFLVSSLRAQRSGQLKTRIEFAACVEEEVSSSKGAHELARSCAPDALIIGEPSGCDAITVGYKGHQALQLRREVPMTHTASDHSSAAAQACNLWSHLEQAAQSFDQAKLAQRAEQNQATQDSLPLYERLLLHLSSVRGEESSSTSHAELNLRMRLPESLPPEQAVAWIEEHAPGWDLEHQTGIAAWSGKRTSTLARQLSRCIARRGHKARFLRKTGTADLNVLAPVWGCPAVAYGPGDSALDHTPNEHLELAEFYASIDTLVDLFGQPNWLRNKNGATTEVTPCT